LPKAETLEDRVAKLEADLSDVLARVATDEPFTVYAVVNPADAVMGGRPSDCDEVLALFATEALAKMEIASRCEPWLVVKAMTVETEVAE
jgi:hypothetical protein